MKLKALSSRKARYGGVTAALTALIIAAVIVVNVIFSALAEKNIWYTDLTPELLFTLSDECTDLIANGDDTFDSSAKSPIEMVDHYRSLKRAEDPAFRDEDLMINIIFCDEPDVWEGDTYMSYVYETAKQLQAEFPNHIKVINHDIIWNPSAVSKYNGATTTSVIIEFGTEYRLRPLTTFFTWDTDDSETPWAYNGEKIFASSILSVTRTESPVACYTTNHAEKWDLNTNAQFLVTLELAGYEVMPLDLATEQIPADCRLIVVMDPQDDFRVKDNVTVTSDEGDEIKKLDKFLDDSNALMVYMSPYSDPLPQFESFLEEWGIVFDRYSDGVSEYSYMITDPSQSYLGSTYTIEANYYTDGGIGSKLTADLRAESTGKPAPIVFQNAMSISYANSYKATHYTDPDDDSIQYDYGSFSVDGIYRSIYDVFVTSESAVAMAGGSEVERATEVNPLKLMTVTVEETTTQESNYTTASELAYVVACGSPEFVNTDVLNNNAYGNNTFLEYALRAIGHETVPVGLTFKAFGDYTIDTVKSEEATQYTVVLTVLPIVISLGAGIFVIVRRKNR